MIVIKDGEELKKCVFITGFHGIGQAGHIATSYLIHSLKARRIGFLRATEIPPFVTTSEEGLITPFELYRADRFVMLRLEFPPSRKEETEIIRSVASWIVEKGLEEAVLIGGLDAKFRQPDDVEELKVVPNTAYVERHGGKLPASILEPGLYVFGPLASLLIELEFYGFPCIALLPYASPDRADPRAAASALRCLSGIYKLNLNISELEEDAREIEMIIERKMRQAKEDRGVYV